MKNKVIIFIIVLIVLLVVQAKFVMPLVFDIASSGLFLEDSSDEKSRVSSNTLMTDTAYRQCNSHVANVLFPELSISFSDKPINAFSLGNYQYVVNADIEITPANAGVFIKRYVCRIKYLNKDDTNGLSEPENWSIEGISGLDNI